MKKKDVVAVLVVSILGCFARSAHAVIPIDAPTDGTKTPQITKTISKITKRGSC
jgi:hypothetical protein